MADEKTPIELKDDVAKFAAFDPTKKKKKKKVVIQEPADDIVDNMAETTEDRRGEDEEGEGIFMEPQSPWEEYLYEENNPELAGDRRRRVMRTPQVLREGTKKTVLANFIEICKNMDRQPEHVMAFLLAEMGTSGSLDGQQRLVAKGKFAPKDFERFLRTYDNDYVVCIGCKRADTILSKESRLFFLRCEKCGSSRTVSPIKTGFIARVERRAN